jgi:N-acetyl-anhydromuramyl-L-alanine amidase AmpD
MNTLRAMEMQKLLAALSRRVSCKTGSVVGHTQSALAAFQRRFRPTQVDGEPDEETQKLLAALSLQLRVV